MRRSTVLLATAAVLSISSAALADPEATLGANAVVPAKPSFFQYGNNFGYTPGWTNPQKAVLTSALGGTTTRIALPESFAKMWGNTILTDNGDMAGYQANGMSQLTCFLQNDSNEVAPTDLDQPIWTSPGVPNPGNTWAVYIFNAVTNYKSMVKVWEVWNEPDFTTNFNATQVDWWTTPPNPADLQNWHAQIYEYVRLLHITYEVAHYVDPTCVIAVGGLGYPSFLDAIMRYTDDPAAGAVTGDFVAHGGAWFDAVSFHHYPMYAQYDDATMTWSKDNDSDVWADGFLTAQKNFASVLSTHGYDGSKYPPKLWLSTETGVSTKPLVGTDFGGTDIQKNYLQKVAILGSAHDVFQIHWFDLADGEADSATTSSYNHMGLYYQIDGLNPTTAMAKPTSWAYATVAGMLNGVTYDDASTTALGLPAGARGTVFRLPDGKKRFALWAQATGNDESATATISFPTTVSLTRAAWDSALTKMTDTVDPSGGSVSLDLTTAPVWLTETTATSSGAGGSGGSSASGGSTAAGGTTGSAGSTASGGSPGAGGSASAAGGSGAGPSGGATGTAGSTSHGGSSTSGGGTAGSTSHAAGGATGAAGHGGASASTGGTSASSGSAGRATATGGQAGSGGASQSNAATPASDSGDSSGCGCMTTSSSRTNAAWLGLLLAVGAAVRRRRVSI